MTILVLSGPSTVLPALADPPVPEGPQTIFPKVFCIRIMDIREVNPNTFDIEFEILNWSNSPVHAIEFDITNPNMGNVVFSDSRIDADGRPLAYDVDVDNDGNFPPGDLGDFEDTNNNGIVDPGEDKNGNNRFDNDEAPGNLPTPNGWTAGTRTATEAVFTVGTGNPIPNIDLLNSATTAIANAKLPNWPVPIDANGVLGNFEDIDNGVNVLDGFVVQVTDLDDQETFNMNWLLFDASGNRIGTPQGGNSMGFGMITLSYLENAGPNPGSPFVGLPSLATDPKDFYGQVYNTNSILFAGVIPAALGFTLTGGIFGNDPGPGTDFTHVGNELDGGDGELMVTDLVPVGDNENHDGAVGDQVPLRWGLLRNNGFPPDTGSVNDLDQGFVLPQQGTNQLLPPLPFNADIGLAGPNNIQITGSNVGGGILASDTQTNLLINQAGFGSGTLSFTGGFFPPPDQFLNYNVQVAPRAIPAEFEFIPNPGPDTCRPGAEFVFGFNRPMNTAILPTDITQEFLIFDNTNGSPVIFGDTTVVSVWHDNQHLGMTVNCNGEITEPVGRYSFQWKDGATLRDDKGDTPSINFISGAGIGSLGGPANQCIFNQSGVTNLNDDCEIRSVEIALFDVFIGGGAIVTILGTLTFDAQNNIIMIDTSSGSSINIDQDGKIIGTSGP